MLIATYETAVVTGAVLAVWALLRRRRSLVRLERNTCLAITALSVLSIVVGAIGTRSGSNPTHSQSFLYFLDSLEPWPFYLAFAGIGAVIAALGPWFSKLVQPYVLSAGLAALAVASASFRPARGRAQAACGPLRLALLSSLLASGSSSARTGAHPV